MDLEELVKIREAERSSHELQFIDPDFYDSVGGRLRELENAHVRTAEPYSREAKLLIDEIRSTRDVVQDVFSTRLKKIVFQAALQAMGADLDMRFFTDGMLKSEIAMYNSVVKIIDELRSLQLVPLLSSQIESPKDLSIDELSDGEHPVPVQEKRNSIDDMMLVRVLRGIPEFLGVDERKWRLGREEVVLLPRINAQVLVNQGAAAEIKVKR